MTLHDGVTVYRTAREGLGLHATRFFKKGDVVWREMPGPFLQHRLSVRFAPSCFGCGALLGSLPDIVGWALCDRKAWCARFTASVESGLFEGPEFRLPQPVPCSGCDALFCSKVCRDAQSKGHHRVLCHDLTEAGRNAWAKYCEHATAHHETFILAAFTIAQTICEVQHEQVALSDAVQWLTQYWAKPWHEQVPEDTPSRSAKVDKRLEQLRRSLSLLTEVLGPTGEGFGQLLELDFYSLLIGMYDLTCVDLNRPHSLESLVTKRIETSPVAAEFHQFCAAWRADMERAEIAQDILSEPLSEDPDSGSDGSVEDAEEKTVLPEFEGIGFSPTVALTNHSCYPNIAVDCHESVEVVATARRDIVPGEQLLMSYGGSDGLRARQRHLWEGYGFHCLCVMCRVETCRAVLAGHSDKVAGSAPLLWLESYAEENGLPLEEVALDIVRSAPPDLFGVCEGSNPNTQDIV